MMTIKTSTLRPGLLVSLKTSLSGNISYQRKIIEAEHIIETGASKAAWETERVITDPAEHEAATKVRNKCRSLISATCATSAFGLLCPEDAVGDLESAIAAARSLADDFNAEAKYTRISVYVMTGRIAPDDAEAVRAINSEVRELMQTMETGIQNLDVKSVRDAANRARNISFMLSPEAEAHIEIAVDTARKVARNIVKAGTEAAQEIDTLAIRKITQQRTAFLDLDQDREVAAPTETGRAVDLMPEDDSVKVAAAPAPAVELE